MDGALESRHVCTLAAVERFAGEGDECGEEFLEAAEAAARRSARPADHSVSATSGLSHKSQGLIQTGSINVPPRSSRGRSE